MSQKNKLAVASLGSGSKGNATLVSNGETTVLIDCGFSLKETLIRLSSLKIEAESIDAILVTHEHQDHIKGVGALSRKFSIPVWASRGTFLSEKCGQLPQQNIIHGFEAFSIDKLQVLPLAVPHDAREPCQYLISCERKKVAVMTDLGAFTPRILEHLKDCDGLVLEFNYDHQMLWNGEYPVSLKQRVGSNYGHLSNEQSLELFSKLNFEKLQWLIASHLSEKNNCPSKVRELINGELAEQNVANKDIEVIVANQNQGYDWQVLN